MSRLPIDATRTVGVLEYARMVAVLCGCAGALAAGAIRVRRRVLPAWGGADARLAECILGLGAVMIVMQVLGTAGLLRIWPLLFGCVGAGAAMAVYGNAAEPDRAADRWRPDLPQLIATAIGLLLLFQWAGPALDGLDRGITDGDSLWYHLPFAAQFAQSGSIAHLDYTGTSFLSWFYPATGELFHAFGMIVAGNHDVLSPLLSITWLGLALLAGWCVGRPFGVGAGSVAALALLLGSALIVEREPGAARTDIAGVAFLLASAAVLARGWEPKQPFPPAVLVIAGLAAGLAAGTRLTLLPPVAVIFCGVLVLSPKPRLGVLARLSVPILATGGYWYARNLIASGNPLPWIKLGIGPVVLAGAIPDRASEVRFSVLHYWHSPGVWRHFFVPGLEAAFGPAWPLVLGLGTAGAALALLRGDGIRRVLGLAAIVAALAYFANPLSAPGPEGAPTTFESNLRYLAPALALGLALLPCFLPLRIRLSGWTPTLFVGLLLFTGSSSTLGGRDLQGSIVLVALAAGAAALAARASRGARGRSVAALAAVVAFAIAGWPALHGFPDRRYSGPTTAKLEQPRLGRAYRWAHDVGGARIATTSILGYGLYGGDLSNRVTYLGVHREDGSFYDPASCAEFREVLDAGKFEYLVLAPEYEQAKSVEPKSWVRSPKARAIISAGPTTVYRISGALDPRACPATAEVAERPKRSKSRG